MKKIYTILSLMIVAVTISFSSCTPDSYDLGAEGVSPGDLVEGIAFTVTHDTENPNIIYLKSLMGSQYTPVWIHPQGYSEAEEVTLKMPFEGTYDVVFGVQTRGEIVYGDTVQFTISEFYPDFVSDDLWTYLTGGVGHSKTWIFDNGKYGLASGELSFQDPADGTPTMSNFSPNWEPGAGTQTGDDNIWDSYMTFTLDGGAFVEVYNAGWKDESGTFMLNTDNNTLSLVNASIIHPESWDGNSSNWRNNLNVVALTENQLRIAVFRDTSSEGEWWYIWNFVSKEYADNYEYEGDEVEPSYDGDANDDLTTSVSTTKTWIVNLEAPYNWADLTGSLLNEWIIGENGIPTYTDWDPPYEEEPLSNVSIKLSKTGDNTGTYEIVNYAGEEFSGSYSIDEKNWIDFGQDIDILVVDWVSVSTLDGKLRIVNVERTISGNVSILHLGRYNPGNENEYITIGLVQGDGSGSDDGGIVGTEVGVDNDKLDYGNTEGDGGFRIVLYNSYGGPTQEDPAVNIKNIVFDNVIQITFTLSGITFKDETKTYTAAIGIANSDWSKFYWGGGSGDTKINGDGTYTVWCQVKDFDGGLAVLVVDIPDMSDNIVDLDGVTAIVDKIIVD